MTETEHGTGAPNKGDVMTATEQNAEQPAAVDKILSRVTVTIERDGEQPVTLRKLVYAWSIDVNEEVEEAVPRTVGEIIRWAGRSSPPRWRRGSTRLTTIVLKDLIAENGNEH